MCLAIVMILGLRALVGIIGMLVLNAMEKDVSQASIAIVCGAFGSLASFLVTVPRGSVGGDNKQDPS